MTTILVVEPEAELRSTISQVLASQTETRVLSEEDAARARERIRHEQIHLVLIDVSTAGPKENSLLAHLRATMPLVPVILLTTDDDDEPAVVESLVLGAASYVPKSMLARDLPTTVRRILGLSGCRRRHARLLESLTRATSQFLLKGNDVEAISVIIGYLLDSAEDFAVCNHATRMNVGVALDEALTNAIVHGNLEIPKELRDAPGRAFQQAIEDRRRAAPYAGRQVEIEAVYDLQRAAVTIRDEGPGFTTAELFDRSIGSRLRGPYGRGIFLMRAFMDEVIYSATGNEVTLIKRRALAPG